MVYWRFYGNWKTQNVPIEQSDGVVYDQPEGQFLPDTLPYAALPAEQKHRRVSRVGNRHDTQGVFDTNSVEQDKTNGLAGNLNWLRYVRIFNHLNLNYEGKRMCNKTYLGRCTIHKA